MHAIARSLHATNRRGVRLGDERADALVRALAPLGLDPTDPAGACLAGFDERETDLVLAAVDRDPHAGDIVAASVAEGARVTLHEGVFALAC